MGKIKLLIGICLVLLVISGLYFLRENNVKTIDYKRYIKLRSHQQFIDKLEKDKLSDNLSLKVYKTISNAESEVGFKAPKIMEREVIKKNNRKKIHYKVKLGKGKTKFMTQEKFKEIMKEYTRKVSRNKKLQASNLATLLYLAEQKKRIKDESILCGVTFSLVPSCLEDLITHKETNNDDKIQQLINQGIYFLEENSELFLNRCIRHSQSFNSYLTPNSLKQIYFLKNKIKEPIYKRWKDEIIKRLKKSIERLGDRRKKLKKNKITEETEISLLWLKERLERSKKILKLFKKSKSE